MHMDGRVDFKTFHKQPVLYQLVHTPQWFVPVQSIHMLNEKLKYIVYYCIILFTLPLKEKQKVRAEKILPEMWDGSFLHNNKKVR